MICALFTPHFYNIFASTSCTVSNQLLSILWLHFHITIFHPCLISALVAYQCHELLCGVFSLINWNSQKYKCVCHWWVVLIIGLKFHSWHISLPNDGKLLKWLLAIMWLCQEKHFGWNWLLRYYCYYIHHHRQWLEIKNSPCPVTVC